MPSVQVICDLRQLQLSSASKKVFDEQEFLREFTMLFQQASSALIGQPLIQSKPLAVKFPHGIFTLWVVDPVGAQYIGQQTEFSVVDILRKPITLYECQKCGDYGPLRCDTCLAENVPSGKERVCSRHAYFIQDTSLAYCEKHRPLCCCSPGCTQTATFFCSGCYSKTERNRGAKPTKVYGEHVRYQHPHNPDIDYCNRCYDRLFRPCRVCEAQGIQSSLGKLRCAFRSRHSKETCGEARCWDHSFQWRIWGPHFAGVILCEQHKQYLVNAEPADVLFMLLSSPPPQGSKENRPYSLRNIYRVRRLLNRNRQVPITFEQLGQAFELLAQPGVRWTPAARKRFDEFWQLYQTFMLERPPKTRDLLYQVRQFYQNKERANLAQHIVWLDIDDQLRGGDRPGQQTIHLYLDAPLSPGLFIGKEGVFSKQLSNELNVRVKEFFCVQNGIVTSLSRESMHR